jgi:cell wall-associated NlpC family hydrolase
MQVRGHLRNGLLAILCSLAMAGNIRAQETGPATTKFLAEMEEPSGSLPSASMLAPEELMLRMGQQIETTDLDCSHFVQWLYEQAGLYYGYAPSRTLYAGMPGFRRVSHPLPGDLIVWPGHVGIVVDPDEQTFLSSLRSGVKTASYTSRYWKRRGRARFYRYMDGQVHFENRGQSVYSQSRGRAASGAE